MQSDDPGVLPMLFVRGVCDMTDAQRALCESLADKEWNDYQEHLRLGGNKLHVRSFFRLGFAAGVESESVRTAKFVNAIKSAEMFGTMAPDEARPVLVYVLNLLRSALKEYENGK